MIAIGLATALLVTISKYKFIKYLPSQVDFDCVGRVQFQLKLKPIARMLEISRYNTNTWSWRGRSRS